jgi:hypothetical protein
MGFRETRGWGGGAQQIDQLAPQHLVQRGAVDQGLSIRVRKAGRAGEERLDALPVIARERARRDALAGRHVQNA